MIKFTNLCHNGEIACTGAAGGAGGEAQQENFKHPTDLPLV